MATPCRRRSGFTLIELMIAGAILGVLASIAVPNYLRFQLKSKTGECKVNLAAIRVAEQAYLSEFGSYVAAASTPAGSVGPTKRSWPASSGGFDIVGWQPEGKVFFQYAVAIDIANAFTATAISDLDGDGALQAWGVTVPTAAGLRVTAPHASCDVTALPGVGQVAPCDVSFGATEF